MEWKKIKNMILGMLTLLCLFLAANLLIMRASERSITQEAVDGAVRNLAEAGITLDADLLPKDRLDRQVIIITRDETLETQLADALLGGTLTSDSQGAGITRYNAETGEAVWRAGAVLEAAIITPEDLPALLDTCFTGVRTDDAAGFTITQQYDGLPVFGNTITAAIDGELTQINGSWALGEAFAMDDKREMALPGLLIGFASYVRMHDMQVTGVTHIEPGYLSEPVSGVGVRLIPYWRLRGDGYTAHINSMNAAVSIKYD